MQETAFQLEHLNIPARDPDGLARWYADTFNLRAEGHLVRGSGVLIAFQTGEPINRAPDLHIGFRVPSMASLTEWANKFGTQITTGKEFASFRISDPDGNCLELYCKASG